MNINLHTMKAYYIEFNVNEGHWQTVMGKKTYLTVIVPFNCFDKPIRANPRGGLYSMWLAKEAEGAEKYYPDYHCWSGKQPALRTGTPVNMLTLKMMQAGCCPPSLMGQYIETEGREADAVEEALKLHKRGYFGGGG